MAPSHQLFKFKSKKPYKSLPAFQSIKIFEVPVTLCYSMVTIVTAFLEGATAEEMTQQYQTLDLADVYSVIGYYLRRRPEIEDYLQRERRQAETVQKQNEARFDPHGIRDRLVARSAETEL